MKSIYLKILVVFVLVLSGEISFAQINATPLQSSALQVINVTQMAKAYFTEDISLGNYSGVDFTDAGLIHLLEEAQKVKDSLNYDVFTVEFPYVSTSAITGLEDNFQLATNQIQSDKYLLFCFVLSGGDGEDVGKFYTAIHDGAEHTVEIILLENYITNKVTSYFNESNILSNVQDAEAYGLSEWLLLESSCNGSLCSCLTDTNQISNMLLLKQFHIINAGLIDEITLTPEEELNDKNLPTIDNYTTFDIGLVEKMQAEIDYLNSKGYSGHGFITSDTNFCGDDFNQVEQDFKNSETDFNIWYHISTNQETGESKLFEKIDNYDDYLISTILSKESYVTGPCGKALSNYGDDCGEPCHGTKRPGRCGNINFNGVIEHWLIEIDYVCYLNPSEYSFAEYLIPNAGKNGGPGYADIVNLATGEIFEIKPIGSAASGIPEVEEYVVKGLEYCPNTAPWSKGIIYPPSRILPNPNNPSTNLVVSVYEAGILSYYSDEGVQLPEPVIITASLFERIKRFMQEAGENIDDLDIEVEVARFLHENPDIANYIKAAAIGAGIAIVIGTIIEDFVTLGAGIADDWASFYIAYRLVRIAL